MKRIESKLIYQNVMHEWKAEYLKTFEGLFVVVSRCLVSLRTFGVIHIYTSIKMKTLSYLVITCYFSTINCKASGINASALRTDVRRIFLISRAFDIYTSVNYRNTDRQFRGKKGLTGYCFKTTDTFCLHADVIYWWVCDYTAQKYHYPPGNHHASHF